MMNPCVITDGNEEGDGRRSEFEATALPHLDALYNMALRMTRDPSAAEDLVQDTFVRAYRFFGRYAKGTNCRAWLYSILRNTFINGYRRSKRQPEAMDFAALEGHLEGRIGDTDEGRVRSPEDLVGDSRLGERVRAALDRLPVEFRMVVVLSLVDGYTYQEISSIMECPIGTVMSRLFRARRLLQAALVDQAEELGLVTRTRSGRRLPQNIPDAPEPLAALS